MQTLKSNFTEARHCCTMLAVRLSVHLSVCNGHPCVRGRNTHQVLGRVWMSVVGFKLEICRFRADDMKLLWRRRSLLCTAVACEESDARLSTLSVGLMIAHCTSAASESTRVSIANRRALISEPHITINIIIIICSSSSNNNKNNNNSSFYTDRNTRADDLLLQLPCGP